LRRAQVLPFFAKLPPCLVGIEACGTFHHWARELMHLGCETRLASATGTGEQADGNVSKIVPLRTCAASDDAS
jgi:hypothetical protein